MNIVLVFYMHNMKAEIVVNLLLGQLSSTFKSGKEPMIEAAERIQDDID